MLTGLLSALIYHNICIRPVLEVTYIEIHKKSHISGFFWVERQLEETGCDKDQTQNDGKHLSYEWRFNKRRQQFSHMLFLSYS